MGRLAELAGILLTNARLHNSLEQELAARVEAQAALQAAYQDLERRVEERTAELAALHMAERDRRAEAERSRRIADGMRQIVAALNSQQSLAETLDFIVKHACRMLNSEGAAVFRLEQVPGGEPALAVQAGCGLGTDFVEQASLPYRESIAGRALRENRPIAVPNIRAPAGRASPTTWRRRRICSGRDASSSWHIRRDAVDAADGGGPAVRRPGGLLPRFAWLSRLRTLREAQSLADQAALGIESAPAARAGGGGGRAG